MSPRVEEVLEIAAGLTSAERAEIAVRLIRSLDEAEDPDAEAAWKVEVARRLDEDDRDDSPGVAWEKAQKEIWNSCDSA